MNSFEILLTTDNLVKFSNIKARETGAALASITSVAAALIDPADDTTVSGSSISLTVVTGEADAYKGYFPSTITLTADKKYRVQITVLGKVYTADAADSKLTFSPDVYARRA